MRILADTNLFIKFCQKLPLPKEVQAAFANMDNELCVSAMTGVEIYRLWQVGKLPDNPDSWLFLALPSWTIIPMDMSIARQAVLWSWEHKDPADRIIAATAKEAGIPLWHTDTVLENFSGFPQRYFRNKNG